jgi:hypothetical protein
MNFPVAPTIPGSSTLSSLTVANIATLDSTSIENAIIQNATINNATITNATITNQTDSNSLTAPFTTPIPMSSPPPKVSFAANTYYYRYTGLTTGEFNTIFTMEEDTNYYCIGTVAADNDNGTPPVIFYAYSIVQVGNFLVPITGGSQVQLGGVNNADVQIMGAGGNYNGLNMIVTVIPTVGG